MTDQDDTKTDIALLKQKAESIEKDIKKSEERQTERIDRIEERTSQRMDEMEGLHKKVLYGMAVGLISILTWFGKTIVDKTGMGN